MSTDNGHIKKHNTAVINISFIFRCFKILGFNVHIKIVSLNIKQNNKACRK